MHGKLIVFEGVEGSGKTTQLQRTYEWLKKHESGKARSVPIVLTRQPGGTELGLGLRQLLLEHRSGEAIEARTELLLYAADRCQHVEGFLKPKLEQGAIVLCDRYIESTIAYQGYGRGLPLDLITQLNQIATGGLESDLTLWLDLDPALGLERARFRGSPNRLDLESLAFHQRVRQGYEAIADAHPQRIWRIDAEGSPTDVQDRIQAILTQINGIQAPSF